MRSWLWAGSFAVVAACGAGCGGNVVVDGNGATTSSSSSSATTSGTTMVTCQQTCLEAVKQGGGVCDGGPGLSAFNVFAGCASLNCSSVCVDLGASGASAPCFDCMSTACPNEVMGCTVN